VEGFVHYAQVIPLILLINFSSIKETPSWR